jgi:hypothetical protein
MDAFKHAELSAKRHGGLAAEYLPIHQFLDSSKTTYADVRHRAILHNAFGIGLAIQVFGQTIEVTAGGGGTKPVSVRVICEEHIQEDLGFIPSVQDWCREIRPRHWMTRDGAARASVVQLTRKALRAKIEQHENRDA